MLDDLKYIHERDGQDALGVVEKQAVQLHHHYDATFKPQKTITNVVVAGMGGSALGATIVHAYPGLAIPFEIVRDYQIPSYVNETTLFIASSYSGNTEETVAALKAAVQQKAQIVVLASGGLLAEAATRDGQPLFHIPSGLQPRMAVLYSVAALVQIFQQANLIEDSQTEVFSNAANWLDQHKAQWLVTVPTAKNKAKQIAQELTGKSIVVYAGPQLFPAAYKWKINMNENAKHIAWCNQYSEFNHNEFLGWTEQPTQKPYAVIDLRSKLYHPRIQKRFEVSEQLLSGKRPAPIIVEAVGDTMLEQLLWTIALGDFVSVYLALLNGINPSPVDLIEKFKKALD